MTVETRQKDPISVSTSIIFLERVVDVIRGRDTERYQNRKRYKVII